ncbi:NUDIX domain-containing protein [Paucibacter sp. XJ19-41]|uniref:NUDIX domain-containing protein n=1 Tax=Paucibacter sp. XJ19-41 TaxID=2927824 RepID=UPI00234C0206|nr:NUDIX hydrolase [Paucibacter sp. XJ19-41]MDC6170818.1 NUDIX hydrolase [Paucibacter sp. XJ19-41]
MSIADPVPSAQPRAQGRAELLSIRPCDPWEREQRAQTLDWVDTGAPLCRIAKPATPPRHLVSYFALVDGEHILLVDHRNARLWLPSGGHVEPLEPPRRTVARELAEELDLVLDESEVGPPRFLTCTTTVGLTAGHEDVSLWYVLQGDRHAPLPRFDAGEFEAVRWFAFDEVPLQRSDPHMGRFLGKLRSGRHLAHS